MLNKLNEMLDHLNAEPNSADGFSARTMYETGMKFGLTCKEVKDIFLGKSKALARGQYPATVAPEILEAAANAPIKMSKAAPVKKAAAKTAAPKKLKNTSTAVVVKAKAKDDAAIEQRRDLIEKIAKRHAAEDKVVAELSAPSSKESATDDTLIQEELETLLKTSVVNPLSA